jgi:hypothetical protein
MVWTDYWQSVASVGCGLICIGAGEERAKGLSLAVPPRSGETSRLSSMNPVA